MACVLQFVRGAGAALLSSAGCLLRVWLSPRVQRWQIPRGPQDKGTVPRCVLRAWGPRPKAVWGCWWEANNEFWLSVCPVPSAHVGVRAWLRVAACRLPYTAPKPPRLDEAPGGYSRTLPMQTSVLSK